MCFLTWSTLICHSISIIFFDVKSDVAFAEPIHIHDALLKKRRRKKIDRNLKISINYVFFVYVLLLKRNICNLYYFLSHNPCWFLTCSLSLFSINYRLCVKISISFKWTFMSVDFCSFFSLLRFKAIIRYKFSVP